jgi:hypothetical protein
MSKHPGKEFCREPDSTSLIYAARYQQYPQYQQSPHARRFRAYASSVGTVAEENGMAIKNFTVADRILPQTCLTSVRVTDIQNY